MITDLSPSSWLNELIKLVSVTEAVLADLIWNAELLSLGMGNDTVERQSAILWSQAVAIERYIRDLPIAPNKQVA